jgi:hypothetical protein
MARTKQTPRSVNSKKKEVRQKETTEDAINFSDIEDELDDENDVFNSKMNKISDFSQNMSNIFGPNQSKTNLDFSQLAQQSSKFKQPQQQQQQQQQQKFKIPKMISKKGGISKKQLFNPDNDELNEEQQMEDDYEEPLDALSEDEYTSSIDEFSKEEVNFSSHK